MKEFLIKNLFKPTFLGLLINPFFITRMHLFFHIKKMAPLFKGNLLDIGCGDKPYEKLFTNINKYEGIEIETTVHKTTKADYFYDGVKFPFQNESFDSVILNEVIEHVFNPEVLLREIHRILKDDGKIMITLPFVWDEHEQPYDYARYSSFGITYLLKENNFRVEKIIKSCPNISVLFQLLNGYIYKVTYKLPKIIRALFILLICFPINLIGIMFGLILPNNEDLYLDNIVLVSKVNQKS